VLNTLAYAERELLEAMPAFKHALMLLHLQSDAEVRAQPRMLNLRGRQLYADSSRV